MPRDGLDIWLCPDQFRAAAADDLVILNEEDADHSLTRSHASSFSHLILFPTVETKRRADVLLHPQRMAILRELTSHPQTTKELGGALPEIPQATLYRQIGILHEYGFVHVVDERKIRGAISRTYALVEGTVLEGSDLAAATPDDLFRYFATFVSGLLGEYGRYLDRPAVAPEADRVVYREYALNLTHDELRELLGEVGALVAARAGNELTEERTPRLVATVTLPVERTTSRGGS